MPRDLTAALRALDNVPDAFTDTFGWDNRKTLLEVFEEGKAADYLEGEDDFHRQYGGVIAVARYAMNLTLEVAREEIEEAAR